MINLAYVVIGMMVIIIGIFFTIIAYEREVKKGIKGYAITIPTFGTMLLFRSTFPQEHIAMKLFALIIIALLVYSTVAVVYEHFKR
jgi:hypothetical protein